MPKVSISLDRETAEAISRGNRSLGEVVKEIVLQYASRSSRVREAGVICNIANYIAEQLESESSNIYSLIGQVKALIKTVETLDLSTSERVYLNSLDSILESVTKTYIDGYRLYVVKILLSIIVLYIVSLLYNDENFNNECINSSGEKITQAIDSALQYCDDDVM